MDFIIDCFFAVILGCLSLLVLLLTAFVIWAGFRLFQALRNELITKNENKNKSLNH